MAGGTTNDLGCTAGVSVGMEGRMGTFNNGCVLLVIGGTCSWCLVFDTSAVPVVCGYGGCSACLRSLFVCFCINASGGLPLLPIFVSIVG